MVRTRVMIGAGMLAAFVGLAAADSLFYGAPLFHALVAVLVVWAMMEFYGLVEQGGFAPQKYLAAGLAVTFIFVQYLLGRYTARAGPSTFGSPSRVVCAGYPYLAAAGGAGVVVLAVAQLARRHLRYYVTDLSATALGLFYVWFLGAHALALRTTWGMGCVVAFVAAAKLGDSGAYFVGTFFGRHRLFPHISPRKTLEGMLGGLAVSLVTGAVIGRLLAVPDLGLGFWALFGLAVGVAAQAGDLVESAMKRAVGAKDSSQLLAVFGGALDLVDSLLLSAPVALWLLELWGRHLLYGLVAG